MMKKITKICAVVLILSVTAGCERKTHLRAPGLGPIPVAITVVADNLSKEETDRAIQRALQAVRKTDRLMSIYLTQSDLSRLNNSPAGEKVRLSPETIALIQKSIELSCITDGAFDITILPLLEIWGFWPERKGRVPTDAEIARALTRVGADKLLIDASAGTAELTIDGMKIDLGAVAKGYAADRAVRSLKNDGVKNALVEIGGEVRALGTNKGGVPWRVGITNPQDPRSPVPIKILEISNLAAATSGGYENFFIADGIRYSHIIDPRTGRPADNNVISATVTAPECAAADALATAFLVLPPQVSIRICEETQDTETLIISRAQDGKIAFHYSSGIKKYLAGANDRQAD